MESSRMNCLNVTRDISCSVQLNHKKGKKLQEKLQEKEIKSPYRRRSSKMEIKSNYEDRSVRIFLETAAVGSEKK